MATDTMYVWSPIPKVIDPNAGGVVREHHNVGDKVTQSDVGVDDAEWKYMVDTGSVRNKPYPQALIDNPGDARSPAEYYRQILSKAATGGASGEELKELQNLGGALTPQGFTPATGVPLPAGVEVPEDTKAAATSTSSSK